MLQRAASARASAAPLSGADLPDAGGGEAGQEQEQEHRALQEENLRLLRETTNLRSDLNASEQERTAICRALGLEPRPLEQAGADGEGGGGAGVAEAAALQGKDRVAAQLRVLTAQRDSIARREAGVSRREADTRKDQVRCARWRGRRAVEGGTARWDARPLNHTHPPPTYSLRVRETLCAGAGEQVPRVAQVPPPGL